MVRILLALAVAGLCVTDASAFGRRNSSCNPTHEVTVHRPLASCTPVQASPQYTVQASPHYTVQASPQYTVQASPQYTVQASPQYTVQASPQYTVQASPQYTVQASPQYTPVHRQVGMNCNGTCTSSNKSVVLSNSPLILPTTSK